LIFACVNVGDKYPAFWVERLRRSVKKYLTIEHEFVCLTDYPDRVAHYGIRGVKVDNDLTGWWAKLQLLDPSWRDGRKVIYLDIDCVPVGTLNRLAEVEEPFAICQSFVRISGRWPCQYNSSCMVIGKQFNGKAWGHFSDYKRSMITEAGRFGDQRIIEWLVPDAASLQKLLPKNFFIDGRPLERYHKTANPGCSVVVFKGWLKPNNTEAEWVKKEWEG
jgi:hypothetical protein